MTTDILVPISPGELIDKITILRIKSARMTDETKLRNVRVELEALEQTWRESGAAIPAVAADEAALQKVNEELWDIEDRIRDKERAGEFDAVFIELARAVYVTNDERARFKKNINTALGSRLVEEKSYQPYR
jgi:hypothetical protein